MATPEVFATGFVNPVGVAFDLDGNLCVATHESSIISKVSPIGVVTEFATGLNGPQGLAFDQVGNLYVANYNGGSISKVSPLGAVTTFVSGLQGPSGLAFDSSGNLYVANIHSGVISKVSPLGAVTTFVSGFMGPHGLAFDQLGNLYVANTYMNMVSKVSSLGVVTPFATELSQPNSLTFDLVGNLYVSNSSIIFKILSTGETTPWITSNLTGSPSWLTCSVTNDIYVSISNGNIMVIYNMDIATGAQLIDFMGDGETNGNLVNDVNVSEELVSLTGIYKNILNPNANMFVNMFVIPVGGNINKDMSNEVYTHEFDPATYPDYFPHMAPFIDENIVAGDKLEDDRLIASEWNDWGNDIFDNWGFFYLYDVATGKYYFPILSPQNQADGLLFTQQFIAFDRTFTIIHGYPAQGIFKFDISVNDNAPFKFGAYGNMGSDTHEINTYLTRSFTNHSANMTLYYIRQQDSDNNIEILYSYFISKTASENQTRPYNLYQTSDDNSLMSTNVTNGLIVYFSKTTDVNQWVINDLAAQQFV